MKLIVNITIVIDIQTCTYYTMPESIGIVDLFVILCSRPCIDFFNDMHDAVDNTRPKHRLKNK